MTNVRTLVLAIRGADSEDGTAGDHINRRLQEVARQINAGSTPLDLDPGVQLENIDPGSGGGPCAPRFKRVDIEVSASGLPEAEARPGRGDDD